VSFCLYLAAVKKSTGINLKKKCTLDSVGRHGMTMHGIVAVYGLADPLARLVRPSSVEHMSDKEGEKLTCAHTS